MCSGVCMCCGGGQRTPFGGLFSPIPGTCDLTKKCSPSAYVVKAWSSADDATLGGAKNLRSGES